MFSLRSITQGIFILQRKQPSGHLINALVTGKKVSVAREPATNTLTQVKNEIVKRIGVMEESYQRFVQTNIDPLLGKTRHAQLQEMLGDQTSMISWEERLANRRLGIGGLALATAAVGQLFFAPLIGIAILLGLSTVWTVYYWAYLEWQRTRRLGALHLTCIYIAVLWLGGYATIGALGSFLVGIALKVKAINENQSRNNLVNIFQLQPSKVWIRNQGIEVEIPFAQLQIGNIVVLQAGQLVPVDGRVVAGSAMIDQHMLTGESQPVEKAIGDGVLAATLLISGKIDIQVEKTGGETTAGQIGQILNESAKYNTAMSLKVFAVADRFVLPTLALSAVTWPLIGPAGAVSLLGANSTINTYVSGSLAVLNFLNLAANASILVKDGSALEQLTLIDTVVFDKTGTLTVEQPQVAQIHTLTDQPAAEVLRLAAAAEVRQSHPIARAILTAAAVQNLQLPALEHAHYEAGLGLKVRLMGDENLPPCQSQDLSGQDRQVPLPSPQIRVGSGRFMTMEGITLPPQVEVLAEACKAQGHSLVMIAVDDILVGCIELQPTVRPEAQSVIEGLRARGLALYIISGDQEAPTRKLAQDLGMTGYYADILPEGKATIVEHLQQQGRHVCFIGDGINDAIAMRKAQVSISLRGATTAATDTAQIILMEGNLERLLDLFRLAVAFDRNLKRNFNFTAGVSIAAAAGILLAGFTFAATEVLYAVSLLGGLGIAMKPLLDHQTQRKKLLG